MAGFDSPTNLVRVWFGYVQWAQKDLNHVVAISTCGEKKDKKKKTTAKYKQIFGADHSEGVIKERDSWDK